MPDVAEKRTSVDDPGRQLEEMRKSRDYHVEQAREARALLAEAAAARDKALADGARWLSVRKGGERLSELLLERDAARQEVETLKADALAIAQSAEEVVKERDALTARVAELEREKADHSKNVQHRVRVLMDERDAAEARATAAEAKVRGLLTACERLEQQHLESAKGAATEGTRTAHRYAAGAAKVLGAMARDSVPPTPAPAGLLEAVGEVLNLAVSPFNGGSTRWSNAVNALQAAYDAAKNGGR